LIGETTLKTPEAMVAEGVFLDIKQKRNQRINSKEINPPA